MNHCQEMTLSQLPTWWWVITTIGVVGAIYFIWDSIRG